MRRNKKLSKNIIIKSQLMGLLQSPAHAFVQTRVHYVCCLLMRKTLRMMRRLNDYFKSNDKCDNYDDVTVDENDDDSNDNNDADKKRKDCDKK
jgi:hypothetical protein